MQMLLVALGNCTSPEEQIPDALEASSEPYSHLANGYYVSGVAST